MLSEARLYAIEAQAQSGDHLPPGCVDRTTMELISEIRALRKIYEAGKDVIRFTAPEWRNDIDRGDADIALAEAIADYERGYGK